MEVNCILSLILDDYHSLDLGKIKVPTFAGTKRAILLAKW